jgi:H+/Cl- antiporter ClcA
MKTRRLRYIRRVLLSRRAWRVRAAFLLGAVLVGAVSSVFGVLSEQADRLFATIADAAPMAPLLLTPLGLVLVAWLARRFFPGSEGSGINQVIAALEVRAKDRWLTLRIAAGKVLLTLIAQVCGAAVGREGPTVHVAAAIMYSMRRLARFPADYMARGMLLAGGAAGISAAFNTPLAGIVFAFEEMLRGFTPRLAGIVVLSVVLSAIVSMLLVGERYYFGTAIAGRAEDAAAWLAVLLCGVVAGLAGGLFAFLILRLSRALAPLVATNGLGVAFVCGAVLVLMGALTDYSVMGSGYEIARALAIDGEAPAPFYPVYKFIASLASYLSGIPGGIFAPALSTGAGIGADLHRVLPLAPLDLMVLLGMVAYFAGAVKSPITGFVIVMEMTDDQNTLLALMAAAMIGYGVSYLLSPQPLYHSLAQVLIEREEQRERARPARPTPARR